MFCFSFRPFPIQTAAVDGQVNNAPSYVSFPSLNPPISPPSERAQMWNFQDEYEDMKNVSDPLEGDDDKKRKKKRRG